MRDYQRRIQRILDGLCEQDVAKGKTVGWKFEEWSEVSGCHEYKFRVPARYSIVDVERVKDEIYASCGAIIELEDLAGAVIVRVCQMDLPKLIPFSLKMLKGLKPMECLIGFNRLDERVTFAWNHAHMLIGSETGFGKTDFIRLLAFCLLISRAEIDIIDMKMMSFAPFKDIPNVTISRSFKEALRKLASVSALVYKRQDEVWKAGNRKYAKSFPKRIVIVDEAADLSPAMYKDDKVARALAQEAERYMTVIARLGREVGVHLVYCTQYPTNEIVRNQIKVNCGARMCFHVDTQVQSEVVLGKGGAEHLQQKGRGIFKDEKTVEVQVPYVGDDDVWYELLSGFKREEHHERKHDSGHVHSESADVQDESHSEPDGFDFTTEEGAEIPKTFGKQKANRKQQASQRRESIPPNRKRKETVYGELDDSTFAEY